MALTTEEKAYNTALIALQTAWKAVIDAGTATDQIILTPLDLGTDATYDKQMQATAATDLTSAHFGTGPYPSFSIKYTISLVDDGEHPIAIPVNTGNISYLFWAICDESETVDPA